MPLYRAANGVFPRSVAVARWPTLLHMCDSHHIVTGSFITVGSHLSIKRRTKKALTAFVSAKDVFALQFAFQFSLVRHGT